MTGRRTGLLAALALAALLSASASPADALTCQVRQHRQKRVCWCLDRGRWVTMPMIVCKVVK